MKSVHSEKQEIASPSNFENMTSFFKTSVFKFMLLALCELLKCYIGVKNIPFKMIGTSEVGSAFYGARYMWTLKFNGALD